MPIFVTGATGHLGANLIRELVARNEQVRVLFRRGSRNAALEGLDVERVEGDLRDARSIVTAFEGCDRVYHLAAFVSIRNVDRARMHEVNVAGTRTALEAARTVGVERMVHCSSFGTIGQNPDGPSDETLFLGPFEEAMDYERSKAAAELEVLQATSAGLDVTIVNPSAIVGPWDFGPSILGQTILDFARGRMPMYVPGAYDFVAMKDAVAGHLLAMDKGKRGERYILTSEVATIDEVLDWLAELTGRPRPKIKIPAGLMTRVAAIKDWVERAFFPEHHPRFNQHSIRLLQSGKVGDGTKARRELGLEPTSLRDAFAEAVEWFRSTGQLP